MCREERILRLGKSVDDMYALIYLWNQLDQGRQVKLRELFSQWSGQVKKDGTEKVLTKERGDV